MQIIDTPDSSGNGLSELDARMLWPGGDPDDLVRRCLASLLLEDPDHRLRVAHLESLLQLHLPAQTGYTSGLGLQTLLLKDNTTAAIFHVDFANTRVTDWRSRVVHLDVPQLSKELAAAKQSCQQQGQQPDTPLANGSSTATSQGNGNNSTLSEHRAATSINGIDTEHEQQRQISPLSSSFGRQQPCTLDHIWGTSPVFGACGSFGHQAANTSSIPTSIAGGVSSSLGAAAGSAGAGEPRVSLFGSSFEVPHAIASCWAAPSSCSSGVGSMGRRQSAAGDPASTAGGLAVGLAAGPSAAKVPAGGILDQIDPGGGGSSTASGSSSRSISAATRAAAAAAASRRKSSNTASGVGLAGPPAAGAQESEGASVAGSTGGMSACLDVSTPKSYLVAGDTSASPVNSSSGEDETEYNEAQLVFDLSGTGTAGAAAAAGAESGSNLAAVGTANASDTASREGPAAVAAAPAGETDGQPLHGGVDWSRIAALQHQQQQQGLASYHSQLQSQSMPGGQQQLLLFGADDLCYDAAPPSHSMPGAAAAMAAAQMMQQQLAALSGQIHTAGASSAGFPARRAWIGADHSALGLLGNLGNPAAATAAAGSLFASPGAAGFAVGSAPAATAAGHDILLQPGHNPAAAVGGFSNLRAAATAAQLAESVLHDTDTRFANSGNPFTMQQMQYNSAAMHGSSYGSVAHSDRSSSGHWGTSPVAAATPRASYGIMHQQQQRPQQQQQQQHRPSDGSVGDTTSRTDQLKQDTAAAAHPAAAGPGKQAGSFAAAVVARDKAAAPTGATASATPAAVQPRLTGWASVAARDPKVTSPSAAAAAAAANTGARDLGNSAAAGNGVRQQQVAGGGVKAVQVAGPLGRLAPAVRAEVQALVAQFTGVLKLDDFDDGVVHQLNAKGSEEESLAAVRHIAHYDLANIQHMAAYLNHLVKHYNHTAAAAAAAAAEGNTQATAGGPAAAGAAGRPQQGGGSAAGNPATTNGSTQILLGQSGSTLGSTLGGPGNRGSTAAGTGIVTSAAAAAGGNLGAFGGQIRLASVPVSTKAMLQKLPLKVFKQLEQLVAGCAYLEWRHFDAGVVKVLAQLSKLCEGDVFEELELLAATDLSNVEYMPAYLNKRLNNKLWSRRKADGQIGSN